MPVEDQKSCTGAGKRATQLHHVNLPQACGGKHQGHRDDEDDAGCQPVGSIQEVDSVLHSYQPEDADWRREQAKLDYVLPRQAEEADQEAIVLEEVAETQY